MIQFYVCFLASGSSYFFSTSLIVRRSKLVCVFSYLLVDDESEVAIMRKFILWSLFEFWTVDIMLKLKSSSFISILFFSVLAFR